MSASAAEATWLLAEAGLTMNQLGRCLGVVGRTVHSWAHGTTPSPRDAERLSELHQLVRGLPAETPEGRRALMLASSNGASLLHRFTAGTPRAQRIQFSIPLIERFGL